MSGLFENQCPCQRKDVTMQELNLLLFSKCHQVDMFEKRFNRAGELMSSIYVACPPIVKSKVGLHPYPMFPPKANIYLRPPPSKKQMIKWIHQTDILGDAISEELDKIDSRVQYIKRMMGICTPDSMDDELKCQEEINSRRKGKSKRCPDALSGEEYDIDAIIESVRARFGSVRFSDDGRPILPMHAGFPYFSPTPPPTPLSTPISKDKGETQSSGSTPTKSEHSAARRALRKKMNKANKKKEGSSGLSNEDKAKLQTGIWLLIRSTE